MNNRNNTPSIKDMLGRLPYSEQIKHPKWQRKRLEILQRDDFTCRSCENTEKTLHVHHIVYKEILYPWEYKDEELITLCEECHEAWHYIFDKSNINNSILHSVYELHKELFKNGKKIHGHQ